MARENDFTWEDDLMTKSFQRQESHLKRLALSHGKDYGKPKPGSASEKRSLAYKDNVMKEVSSICFQISMFGNRTEDGREFIKFGELFKLNEKISNKCVGILQRARKHRLLHFSGETLWQGKDDQVVITLLRRNREIQIYFDHTKELLPNGTNGNVWIDIDSRKRAHFDFVTNVREVDDHTVAYHIRVNLAETLEDHSDQGECLAFTEEDGGAQTATEVSSVAETYKLTEPPLKLCAYKEYVPYPSEQAQDLPLFESVFCDHNLLEEASYFLQIQVQIHQLIINHEEEEVVEVTAEEVTTSDIFTYTPIKRELETTANLLLNLMKNSQYIHINCPTEHELTTSQDTVQRLESIQPNHHRVNVQISQPTATQTTFARSVYAIECPTVSTPRKSLDISIPPLPQYLPYTREKDKTNISPTSLPRNKARECNKPQFAISRHQFQSPSSQEKCKLKFNKCTTLYEPAKPVYESYKQYPKFSKPLP